MKVGDLVRYAGFPRSQHGDGEHDLHLGLGIVLGFDEDGDPAIHFQREKIPLLGGVVYYLERIEVVNESG
jgi:hypothetical protein